jgi:hypothetical protein
VSATISDHGAVATLAPAHTRSSETDEKVRIAREAIIDVVREDVNRSWPALDLIAHVRRVRRVSASSMTIAFWELLKEDILRSDEHRVVTAGDAFPA